MALVWLQKTCMRSTCHSCSESHWQHRLELQDSSHTLHGCAADTWTTAWLHAVYLPSWQAELLCAVCLEPTISVPSTMRCGHAVGSCSSSPVNGQHIGQTRLLASPHCCPAQRLTCNIPALVDGGVQVVIATTCSNTAHGSAQHHTVHRHMHTPSLVLRSRSLALLHSLPWWIDLQAAQHVVRTKPLIGLYARQSPAWHYSVAALLLAKLCCTYATMPARTRGLLIHHSWLHGLCATVKGVQHNGSRTAVISTRGKETPGVHESASKDPKEAQRSPKL